MEHPFFPTATTQVEAMRWLSIAEKLLVMRDLVGSKSFATRAHDSDPTLSQAEQILAIVDTLIAGERRIGSNQADWYAVLRLTPQQGRDSEVVATQYRKLASLVNPQNNKFPFADAAFRLVVDAWSVLSDSSRKSLFDKDMAFNFPPQSDPFSNPMQSMHQNFVFFGEGSSSGVSHPLQPQSTTHFPQVQVHASTLVEPFGSDSVREPQNFTKFASGANLSFGSGSEHMPERRTTFASNVAAAAAHVPIPEPLGNSRQQTQTARSNGRNLGGSDNFGGRKENAEGLGRTEGVDTSEKEGGPTFWTACPYCYYMYEYSSSYVDCTLKCQNCRRAFQGVVVPSPPPIVDGQEDFFCCWGFLPLGFSSENWEKNKGAASSWTPFSPMFSCPQTWNGISAPKQVEKKSSAPRVYFDDVDDEVFVEVSDSSESDDDDWTEQITTEKQKTNSVKRKGASGTPNRSAKKTQADKAKEVSLKDGVSPLNGVETPSKTASQSGKKRPAVNSRKQPGRVANKFGKLDLNVEFSNEADEPAPIVDKPPSPTRGEDDNIEGAGFFEGLDEFLSSLPILNVVADDNKVVKAAL